jgi:hypothetical protein
MNSVFGIFGEAQKPDEMQDQVLQKDNRTRAGGDTQKYHKSPQTLDT